MMIYIVNFDNILIERVAFVHFSSTLPAFFSKNNTEVPFLGCELSSHYSNCIGFDYCHWLNSDIWNDLSIWVICVSNLCSYTYRSPGDKVISF